MKTLKRLLALVLCFLMAISVVACGGPGNTGDNTGSGNNGDVVDEGNGNGSGGNGNEGTGGGTPVIPTPGEDAEPTIVNIQGYEAGVNLNWLRTLCAEFEEIHKDTTVRANERGVEFKIDAVSSTDSASMQIGRAHV